MHAADIVFNVGDLLHDDTLMDIGILIECHDSHREYEGYPDSNVRVWRTWWVRAGEETYSEFGLQNLVAMGVFTRYSMVYSVRDGNAPA
jgi:hypothetical protein